MPGKWISRRVMEIYLQEVIASTFLADLEPTARERMLSASSAFPDPPEEGPRTGREQVYLLRKVFPLASPQNVHLVAEFSGGQSLFSAPLMRNSSSEHATGKQFQRKIKSASFWKVEASHDSLGRGSRTHPPSRGGQSLFLRSADAKFQ